MVLEGLFFIFSKDLLPLYYFNSKKKNYFYTPNPTAL